MKWVETKKKLPPMVTEVLVLVDGHRTPAWSNTYMLVAFLSCDGKFYEERHERKSLIGVTHWKPLPKKP
jgi:hypothetical protein